MCGLSVIAASGGHSLVVAWAFSLQWLFFLWGVSSGPLSHCGMGLLIAVAFLFVGCGSGYESLCSCDAQAQLLCSIWHLPRSGIEPMSPVLAGRFLTTGPPGKSGPLVFKIYKYTHMQRELDELATVLLPSRGFLPSQYMIFNKEVDSLFFQ